MPIGRTAAPAPWSPRAKMSNPMFDVSAQISDPTVISRTL